MYTLIIIPLVNRATMQWIQFQWTRHSMQVKIDNYWTLPNWYQKSTSPSCTWMHSNQGSVCKRISPNQILIAQGPNGLVPTAYIYIYHIPLVYHDCAFISRGCMTSAFICVIMYVCESTLSLPNETYICTPLWKVQRWVFCQQCNGGHTVIQYKLNRSC